MKRLLFSWRSPEATKNTYLDWSMWCGSSS